MKGDVVLVLTSKLKAGNPFCRVMITAEDSREDPSAIRTYLANGWEIERDEREEE